VAGSRLNFETGIKASEYRWGHMLLAIPVGALLRAYINFCRVTSRITVEGPPPPRGSIIFFIHRDMYTSLIITRPFLKALGTQIIWLGYHGFYSYVPWRWFIGHKVMVCRYDPRSKEKPFSFILNFMKRYPDRTYVQYTDSFGPYGRVRESLVRLAQEMGRPVVASRVLTKFYLPILKHNFPLPFARLRLCFAPAISLPRLKSGTVAEGREIIQTSLDALR